MELNIYVYFKEPPHAHTSLWVCLELIRVLNEDCASFGICFRSTIIEIVLFLHFLNNHSVAAQRKAHFFFIYLPFIGGRGRIST